jgi:hypothetical protein
MSNPAILIVEGEVIIAVDIANMLRRLGYEVMGLTDTREEAVEIARLKRPRSPYSPRLCEQRRLIQGWSKRGTTSEMSLSSPRPRVSAQFVSSHEYTRTTK